MVSHQLNGKLWQYWCELFLLNLAKIYEIIEKLCVEVFHSTSPKLLADIIPRLIGLWIDKNYLLINFPFKLSGCHAKNDFMIGHSDIITLRIIQYKWELVPELLTIFETNSWSKILTTVWLFEWCLLRKIHCHEKIQINFRISEHFGEVFGMVDVGQLHAKCIKRQRYENADTFTTGETEYWTVLWIAFFGNYRRTVQECLESWKIQGDVWNWCGIYGGRQYNWLQHIHTVTGIHSGMVF